ncbi:MAG: hypothetical protein CL833_05920 [Crocinitomicaceae bacterium]|nr:hypothetical protein [Crocinitomicaceae bacterium]|tara:strand:- start:126 stop:671 length:546 start_codon:yes stop_codon:yes gene_type:complete
MGVWGGVATGAGAGAATGAATGAAIGSIIPGVGTAIGAGVGGLLGLLGGAGLGGAVGDTTDSLEQKKQKSWKELSTFEKASLTLDEGFSSVGQFFTGDDGPNDAEIYINRAKKLDEGASADAVTSLQTGGEIYGTDTEGKEPQGQQGGGQTLSDRILGRPAAINQDASLEDTNFNNNNFSF